MPEPLPLKFTATIVCLHTLLLENPVEVDDNNIDSNCSTRITPYLSRLLETDCFTAVSEDILRRIVKFCPTSLTNRLLHALVPPYLQDLNLKDCLNVRLMGLVETFKKCGHLHKLNLSSCTQLIHPDIFTFIGLSNIPLTTVVLDENASVTDEVVHTMILSLPGLETLSISLCTNITNNVFLLDEDLQYTRTVSPYSLCDKYSCSLTSIDISGCQQLTTIAIEHLVSLCGPNLRHVNISWTSVNCIGMLYLAGYSLPAILDMLLTDDALESDVELNTVLQRYRELRDIYVETLQESKKVDEPNDLNGHNNDMNADVELQYFEKPKDLNKPNDVNEDLQLPSLNEPEDIAENKKINFDNSDEDDECTILDYSDIQFDIDADKHIDGSYSQSVCSEAEDGQKFVCIEKMVDNLGLLDEGIRNYNEIEIGEMLPDVSKDSTASLKVKTEWKEDAELDVKRANDLNEPKEINDDRDTRETPPIPAPNINDKLKFYHTTYLFQPKILSLNISFIQFVSKRTNLGKLCLEKFLDVNKCLKKFSISWKGLTFDYFMKIVRNLTELDEVDLEECNMLQSAGVAALGTNCRKCRKVNLRGVLFISDSGLTPFLSNRNLEIISLAESDITDDILIKLSRHLQESLTSLDLSWCEEITEKGINALCSSCSNLKGLRLRKCPVSDFTLQLLSEISCDLEEVSIESVDSNGDTNLTDQGVLTIADTFKNLRIIDISWNLEITDISVSAIMMNCCLIEEANLKGLKQITVQPFLGIISDMPTEEHCKDSDCKTHPEILPQRSTVYAPNLHVLDLDYSDLVNDQLLQRIVNVCRGTIQVTDYYGQKLQPE